jgi:hypothetical protein
LPDISAIFWDHGSNGSARRLECINNGDTPAIFKERVSYDINLDSVCGDQTHGIGRRVGAGLIPPVAQDGREDMVALMAHGGQSIEAIQLPPLWIVAMVNLKPL